MNAVEIEQAVSELAEQAFDPAEFAFSFLHAFGNKDTTIKRLRNGESNKSDLGGVLQTNQIHIKVAEPGRVGEAFEALKASPATKRFKARFVLATDGVELQAEDLTSDEAPVICALADFPNHFGSFLALAGISTVKQVRESTFDIRATSRLNRLYVELLKDNPDWGTAARRPDMNHFMARLIFCFFAEDTDIFNGKRLFTATVEQMTERDGADTHAVISAIFTAMNTPTQHNGAPDGRYRREAGLRPWADAFPYVNGGLFSGSTDVPRFSRIARSYLINIGSLDWTKINPDIFGSMIQAVADDEERGALGMHYTSVPNILKVLNPLFLDDLREKLYEAGDNARKLLNLRNRMARIRVFDPACGSGNFLVIAYKEMRGIEAEINQRRGEQGRRSDIPLTNFRGIELRHFPAEIARLALIITEYQADVVYRGQKEALAAFLPLDQENWIKQGNALDLDWMGVCPPAGTGVRSKTADLLGTPLDQTEIDFQNEGGEIYICGNPPYKGARKQEDAEKRDLQKVFDGHEDYKDTDYVVGWFLKAAQYFQGVAGNFAFVSTSSICQGEQVQYLWPRVWAAGLELHFAYTPFKWKNNASNNAGVYVVIVGIGKRSAGLKTIYEDEKLRQVDNISPYLTAGPNVVVSTASDPLSTEMSKVVMGNMARDDGNLIMSVDEARALVDRFPEARNFLLPLIGTKEIASGTFRMALHLLESNRQKWESIPPIANRVNQVRAFRNGSKAKTTNGYANVPYRFAQYCHQSRPALTLPSVAPERTFVTPILIPSDVMVTNLAYLSYGFALHELALISSKLHIIWARAVSGRHGSGLRYTPTISLHTFPVPLLTDKNRSDLSRCAEDILLAREANFPSTIADLYESERMPDDLAAAHDSNDEVLERIYIGRRFRNDTERLEKLFELYTKMVANDAAKPKGKTRKVRTDG